MSPGPEDVLHDDSPAELIRQVLIFGGVGGMPTDVPAPAWPIYVGHLPDQPDNAIAVFDTAGIRDGRIMATGESITKPGWQLRVRARTYDAAHARIRLAQRYLDTVRNLTVAIDGEGYKIHAVTQTGDVLAIGQDTRADRRENFTLNGTITKTEI